MAHHHHHPQWREQGPLNTPFWLVDCHAVTIRAAAAVRWRAKGQRQVHASPLLTQQCLLAHSQRIMVCSVPCLCAAGMLLHVCSLLRMARRRFDAPSTGAPQHTSSAAVVRLSLLASPIHRSTCGGSRPASILRQENSVRGSGRWTDGPAKSVYRTPLSLFLLTDS